MPRSRAYTGKKGKVARPVQHRLTELKCKEVINICDGARLGYVQDAAVELPCGQIAALVVPGPCHLLGPRQDYVIPWGCIRQIGPDIILVDVNPEQICVPRPRKTWI